MNRLILIVLLGFISGILWELYLKISIAFFVLPLLLLFIFPVRKEKRKNKNTTPKPFKTPNKTKFSKKVKLFKRHLKIILKPKIVVIFILFTLISNWYTQYLNGKYETIYCNRKEEINVIGIVISSPKEKQYNIQYKIKVESIDGKKEYQNTYLLLNIKKKKGKEILLSYGDKISIKGEYEEPEEARNESGFNYKEYLKTIQVYGSINSLSSDIKVLKKNQSDLISLSSNWIKEKMKEQLGKILDEKTSKLCMGILVGETKQIEKEIKTNFRDSNLSHMLAVSGAHVSYVILGMNFFLKKFHKRKAKYILVIFLIFFLFLTDFTPSVTRACISSCIILLAEIFYRKADFLSSLSFSLLILLIFNPFSILSLGLQLSYGGTIGIVVFHKLIESWFEKRT